jgi:hypothetical protein
MSFLDLIQPGTVTEIRDKIRTFAVAAGLKITNWRGGGVGQQMFEMNVAMTDFFTQAVAKAVRGVACLDTSTDPGDDDPYDPLNATLPVTTGYLSAKGESDFGTKRGAQTFASGVVTFVNAAGTGSVARTIAPYGLNFTGTTVDGITPTYHNTPDATVYTEAGGTITIPVGSSVDLPVECDFAGALGTRATSTLSLTTTLLGCTATNAAPVTGNDRENVALYREACRAASARLSLGGPSAAYEYLANKNLDGTVLLNGSGNEVGITRTQVSQESTTGIVLVYYAAASGAPISEDVTAANLNIEQQCMAVPDCITFAGYGATEVSIPVVGTASIKLVAGVDANEVKAAIVAKLGEEWELIPIGGYDQDAFGNGSIYISDIEGIARSAYPGLYNVNCGADGSFAVAAGQVATLNTAVTDWTITVVA